MEFSVFILLDTETVAFPVHLRDGSGNLITTVNISNTQPFKYDIGATNTTFMLVPESDLHVALKNRGIVIDGEKKFYGDFERRCDGFILRGAVS